MRNTVGAIVAITFVFVTPGLAQRPSDPALLVPQQAPALEYAAVADALVLPSDVPKGAYAAVAFDAQGHLYALTRGPKPLMEFDADGTFIRAFGDGLFVRSHGLRIDRDGNLWATDVGAHVVMKLSPQGQVLFTLGTKGQAGSWDETAGTRLLNQPNDVAIAANGDIFVAQGHTPGAMGDPRVLKFDRNGKFLKSWGGKGREAGKFEVAHGLALDARGLLWVADRENQRIQVFDQDGTFVRQMKYAGLPCSFAIARDAVFMSNGFAG